MHRPSVSNPFQQQPYHNGRHHPNHHSPRHSQRERHVRDFTPPEGSSGRSNSHSHNSETSADDRRRASEPPHIDWHEFTDLSLLYPASTKNLIAAKYRGTDVVIKTPSERLSGAELEAVVTELQREAQIMMRLDHPNIIKFYGQGWLRLPTGQVGYFLVVERLHGTLAERLRMITDARRPRPLPTLTLVDMLQKLARGLDYLHMGIPEYMIVHRDLKPDNIGFAMDGTLKIFDFGLSGVVPRSDLNITRFPLDGFRGSVRYMAPEVVLGKPYCELIDVYSFAIVAWEIIHLEKPYNLLNVETHRRVVCQEGARPDITRRGVPLHLNGLLQLCWQQDPERRPPCANIVRELNAIANESSHQGVNSPGVFRFFRRRRKPVPSAASIQ